MSSIIKVDTIQNQSGANIISESANTITVGASGDTITVPSGATFDVSSATVTGTGITEADQWRVTTDFSLDQNPVASNWERNDTDFALIGTGMTQSSGIFTFPSTGIYFVEYGGTVSSTDENRWTDFKIEFTTNNSTYNLRAAQGTAGFYVSTNSIYSSARSTCILDVTNTSTHKVRFSIDFHSGNAIARGSSSYQYHGATFIRLGDT